MGSPEPGSGGRHHEEEKVEKETNKSRRQMSMEKHAEREQSELKEKN